MSKTKCRGWCSKNEGLLKCWEGHVQHPLSYASAVCEPRTSRCSSWFRKGRGTRDQIANICWIIEKARGFPGKHFCFTDYMKAFDCVDHKKVWKILKVVGIPDHLTCLLRNLYAEQEATIRTGYGTTGSKLGKDYIKSVYWNHACLTYMQGASCKMPD